VQAALASATTFSVGALAAGHRPDNTIKGLVPMVFGTTLFFSGLEHWQHLPAERPL